MTGRWRIPIAAFSLAGWMVVMPAGVASADCTGAGDFGAGSGCPPPNSSSDSDNTESWPPTSVDWPPQLSSDSDSTSDSGGGKSGDSTKATPIVMPDGQKAPPATAASKPIVGSSSTSTSTSSTPTPIVMPNTGG